MKSFDDALHVATFQNAQFFAADLVYGSFAIAFPVPRENVGLSISTPPENWLVVFAPTTAYSLDDEPLRTVEAGAWYHLVGQEANWAMAVAESDPPEDLVWIQLDSRVQVTSG